MPNERRAGLHAKNTHSRSTDTEACNVIALFFFLLRVQAYPNKAAFKEEVIQSFFFLCFVGGD